jgi:hypothetical protein
MKWFYILIVVFGLMIFGQYKPQIALSIAAVIFLGTLVYNSDRVEKIMKGEFKQ